MAEIIPFPRRASDSDDLFSAARGLMAALFVSVLLFWLPVAAIIWAFVW